MPCGFTLIEVMVAAAVLGLLLVLVFGAVQGVMTGMQRSRGNIEAAGDGGVAVDMAVRDLESITTPTFPGCESLRIGWETVGGRQVAKINFLAATSDDDSAGGTQRRGALRAIAYRIAHQNPIDGGSDLPSFGLYRTVAGAVDTFDKAIDNSGNLPASPVFGTTTDPGNFLAGRIAGFDVLLRRADGTWTRPGQEISITSGGATVDGTASANDFVAAEVSVVVLTPAGEKQLQAGRPIDDVLRSESRRFVRQTGVFAPLP